MYAFFSAKNKMNSLPVDAFSFHHPFLTHATREFTYRYFSSLSDPGY
jgi:hypothetical protein